MNQFTNIKYIEPELEQQTVAGTADSKLSSLSSIPKTGIFNTQIGQESSNKIMTQPEVANKQTLGNRTTTQEIKVNGSPTEKTAPKEVVKKEYLLPVIYKKLFNYFSLVFNTNKPKKSDIENLSSEELREYADSLLIRNQELKSYLISLTNWQNKFTRSTPVPRSAPASNSNFKSNQTPGFNKPGLPARVGFGTEANTINKPGMPNTARPTTPIQNRPGMPNITRPTTPIQNRPGMPNTARPTTPVQNRPGMPNTARPTTPVQNRPGMPNTARPTTPVQNRPGMPNTARPTTTTFNRSEVHNVVRPDTSMPKNPQMSNIVKPSDKIPNKPAITPKLATPITSAQSPTKNVSVKAVIK